jgi:hypothetical protein
MRKYVLSNPRNRTSNPFLVEVVLVAIPLECERLQETQEIAGPRVPTKHRPFREIGDNSLKELVRLGLQSPISQDSHQHAQAVTHRLKNYTLLSQILGGLHELRKRFRCDPVLREERFPTIEPEALRWKKGYYVLEHGHVVCVNKKQITESGLEYLFERSSCLPPSVVR